MAAGYPMARFLLHLSAASHNQKNASEPTRSALKEEIMSTQKRSAHGLAFHLVCGAILLYASTAWADSADRMNLTDEPGNWYRSQATGTPLAVINQGQRVDFIINGCCTNTRH